MADTSIPIKGRRALVLGGGIAGLAAAGVLSRHFEEVTLVERDRYPASSDVVRPHTPQGAHVHALLAGGLVAMSQLVPELPEWFDEIGIEAGDLTHHTRMAFDGRWLPRARSGIPIRTGTRSDVEFVLRRDLARRRNVRVVDEAKVEGLLGREKALGARVSRGGAEEEMGADLVVDAMGRGSPSARWLAEAGLPRVEERIVDPGIVYASSWFQPPADIDDDWKALVSLPSLPRQRRMTIIARFAPDRMLCSVGDYGKPPPPRNHDELIARMGDVCVPQISRLLRASKPASEIAVYGNTQNRMRRFAHLPWLPEGLVILGDAACSLNPRYGQGMTVAALSAERLDKELSAYFAARGSLKGFPHHFQKSLERMLTVPWQIALAEDRGWISFLSGSVPPLLQRITLKGFQRVLKTAMSDIDTYIRFMRVAQMLDGPATMLAPGTLAKIAMGGRPKGGQEDAPTVGSA
jgi:2-polyprenyl-6-methoxyphenol hydroxylase-like FAD-dependent oxidoreductase